MNKLMNEAATEQSPEWDPHKHSQLISDKGAKQSE